MINRIAIRVSKGAFVKNLLSFVHIAEHTLTNAPFDTRIELLKYKKLEGESTMRKKFLLAVIMTMCSLAACQGSRGTEVTPTDYQVEEVQITQGIDENIQETKEGEAQIEEEEHLLGYEEFDWWNESDIYNGFVISERQEGNELFYNLVHKSANVNIVIDKDLFEARIVTDKLDKTIKLPDRFYAGGTNGGGFFHLMDVTGDGSEELIFAWGEGGTGAWDGGIDIYNMDDLSKYEIEAEEKMISQLEEEITLEPLFMDSDKNALCKVTEPNGDEKYMLLEVWNDEKKPKLSDFNIVADGESGSVNYDVLYGEVDGRNGIRMRVGINMPDICAPASYLGSVEDWLIYDTEKNIFRLEGNQEVVDIWQNILEINIQNKDGRLSLEDEEWKFTITNNMKSENISYLHAISFQKQNELGEWETMKCTQGVCGMKDPLKVGESVDIVIKNEWYPELKEGSYRVGVLCSMRTGKGENDISEVYFYEDMYVIE